MRLVNADELREEFELREKCRYYSSEPYLDYTLNEWKTRPVGYGGYNPICVVNEAPTVEAIPIEWLENWKRGKTSIEQVVADKIMMDYIHRD